VCVLSVKAGLAGVFDTQRWELVEECRAVDVYG
jgi:hypothetical protein